MDTNRDYDAWIGRDVYDAEGERIGEIRDIYYDQVTQRPEWLAIKTGLFGMSQTFVPIQGATEYQNGLQVGMTKDHIKDAPRIDPEGRLTMSEEQMLWNHYGYDYTGADERHGYGAGYDTKRVDQDYDSRWDRDRGDVVAEATATNERVTKQDEDETVRLRKYTWTEQVPVQREEVRVEKEAQ